MFIYTYQALYIILSPLIALLLLYRVDTRKRLPHFIGFFQEEENKGFPKDKCLWIHAVSFGEAKIALEFLKEGLQNNRLPKEICFTTTIEDAMVWFQR